MALTTWHKNPAQRVLQFAQKGIYVRLRAVRFSQWKDLFLESRTTHETPKTNKAQDSYEAARRCIGGDHPRNDEGSRFQIQRCHAPTTEKRKKVMTVYDPNTPNTKYFGNKSDSKAATELMKSNPTEYKRRKELALSEGLIARSECLNPNIRDRWNPKQFSAEELTILAEEPESETSKYFGASAIFGAADALQKMAQENNPRYQRLRQAAQLRGKIETQPSQPVPTPKPVSQFFKLSNELADQAGLPRGYETNQVGLATVLKVVLEVKERKAAAAAQAAKSAAQLERDRIADESAAEFGRLLEVNREIAAKQKQRDGEVPTT